MAGRPQVEWISWDGRQGADALASIVSSSIAKNPGLDLHPIRTRLDRILAAFQEGGVPVVIHRNLAEVCEEAKPDRVFEAMVRAKANTPHRIFFSMDNHEPVL